MANLSELPSPVVMREFEAVARRATQFAEGLRTANRLPNDFPKMQVEEICKTLIVLPNATTQGGRVQLGYANLRLPDVRGEFFSLDSGDEDGQPARDEGVDDQFSLLIAAVATAIGTIDRESGKRPAEEPPAMRYPADQNDPSLAATIASGKAAADGLGVLGHRLAEITRPESTRADLLRRKVADGRGLVVLARAELMFREVVPQWTRKLGKEIEKTPDRLEKAAKFIDKSADIGVLFLDQWNKFEQDIQELGIKNVRQFATNLRAAATILRDKKEGVGESITPTAPPPDFDIEKVKAMILAGQSVPPDWVPWVKELNFDGAQKFINAAPLAEFINLEKLDLRGTDITDASPLAGLVNLQTLFLFGTLITDVSPLARLTNLQRLYLNETGITDVTPLAGLVNLQELYLFKTNITDAAPLAGLVNLQTLNLWDTGITDAAPLAGLINLQELDLGKTGITDVAPLAGLINLQTLDLVGTGITDATPLAGLINLQRLYLYGTNITDVTPLAGLINLRDLSLGGRGIIDVASLAGLVNLRVLSLSSFQINNVTAIARLSNLRSLDLQNTSIIDIVFLAALPSLSEIHVESRKRAEEFLSQLGAGWRIERLDGYIRFSLRRDVPGVEVDD